MAEVFICFLSLSSQPRSSAVSAVFVFNASLNCVAPAVSTSLPVDEKRKSELLMDVFCVSSFFRIHSTDRA